MAHAGAGTEGPVNMPDRRRTGRVTSLAILQLLTGAIFVLGGTYLLTVVADGEATLLIFGSVHVPLGVSILISGAASFLSAKRWVWTLGLVVALVSLADDIVAFIYVPLPLGGMIGTAVVLVTALVVVNLLVRQDVRSFFRN